MKVQAIPMPLRVAALPRHRDLPVPAMVQYDEHGVPDFRVIDMEKWGALVQSRGCGICGARMGARVWFIGGPLAIANRMFTDLAMHKDCAEYALQVCPWLALPRYRMIDKLVEMEGVVINVNEWAATKRPEDFMLAASSGYKLALIGATKQPVLWANPFSSVETWHEGRRVE